MTTPKTLDWRKIPLRKPLALYSAVLIGAVVLISTLFQLPIDETAGELLKWLGVTCVGGYYTTSTVEAVKKA